MENAVQKTAYFNFPKAHILVHYKGHVEWLGTLSSFSTEAGESAHKRQVKEGYNHSNRHRPEKQIIEYYTRISMLAMREQNIRQLVKEGIYLTDIIVSANLLPSSGKPQGYVSRYIY